jgi:hypothetical protein
MLDGRQAYLVDNSLLPPTMLGGTHLGNLTHVGEDEAVNEWKMIKDNLLQDSMANGKHLLPYAGPKPKEKAGGRHELHRYM